MKRLAAGSCISLILGVAPAYGQAASSDPRRVEVSAGVEWQGRTSFGSRDANETTGSGGTFRLFSAASELTSASGFAVRVSMPLIRRIAVEATGRYSTPDISTRVTSDVETSNAPITAAVHVKQFALGGAALWYPGVSLFGSRAMVFVRAGAAFDRRLEDDGTRVVDGTLIEAGGGLKYLLGSRRTGWWRALGARADILALARGAAASLDGRTHVSPALGASMFVRF